MYTNKLVTTRRAIKIKTTCCSQVMEPGASNNPPDSHYNLLFVASWWRGLKTLLSQCVPFSLIDVGRVSSADVYFSFLFLGEGLLGAWQWRAGEGESGRSGAWPTKPQVPSSSASGFLLG
eukprot:1160657-Pelagomonas_calceolata.AAC.7